MPNRFFRLRVRNADDDADALVLTSVPGGVNPLIAAAPHGDGEEIDVITGAVRHGAYTVLAADPSGSRPITSVLADASGFWQLLGRKAFIETSTDGSAWSPRTAGYVQAVRFPDAISAEFTIGDAQRIDLTREVFAEATTEFPGATALCGGPCVGGTGPFKDNGAWRMRVVDAVSGPPGDVGLTFVRGFIPSPTGFIKATSLSMFARDYINSRAYEFATPGFTVFRFPGLVARTVPAGGGSTLTHTPYARAPLFTLGRDLISAQLLLTLSWNGTLPSVNDEFDVYVFPRSVSEANPLHVQGHPIDILTDLWTEAGIVFDSTLAASTKAAIGADAWLDLRFTEGRILADFARDVILGPWGVGWRTGSDGERELFTTRKRSASNPSTTLTNQHNLAPADSQPILFDLDEASIVDAVTYRQREFLQWTDDLEGERPPDDVVSFENAERVLLNDLVVSGEEPRHELEYSIPGTLRVASGGFKAFAHASAADILLRFGFGCPSAEWLATEAEADPLGNEVILDVAHQINGNVRGGERIVQIVRRTPEADGGVSLKLLDAGVTAQIGTAPTLTLAAIGKNAVEVTITNKATLDAAGWNVRVEWGFGGSQPSEGALLKVLTPTDDDVFDTPQVDSGARVWVRARSERYDRRPSAFSSWSDVNLTDLVAPSSLSRSVNTLSWTLGESDRLIKCRVEYSSLIQEVALLPAGSTSFDFTPFVIPSTSTTLRVSHVDELPYLGASTEATLNYTTAAGSSLAAPVAFAVGVGEVVFGWRFDGQLVAEATATQFPTMMEFDVAVETSVGSGTYGSFTTFARVPSVVGGPTKAELRNLPKDGKNRRFRCRLIGPSFSASSYTSNVDVIPWGAITKPPTARRNFTIMTDAGVADGFPARASALDGDLDANIDGDTEVQGGSLFIEDDESLPVGTIATPSAIEKPLRIPAAAFVPATDQIQYQFVTNQLRPRVLNSQADLYAAVVIPDGVTMVEWSARLNEGDGGAVSLILVRLEDETTGTTISALAGTSSGWETVSDALDEDTTGFMYAVFVTLNVTSPPGTQTDAAALFEVSISYDVPDHTKTL